MISCNKLINFAQMISINEHIEYLISRHDCVVVPGWGAFIAQYQPAYFDDNNGVMLPPVRLIGFNQDIKHNDGLIATSVMRRENISYDAAVGLVETEVETIRYQFESDAEVSIGRVGVFRKSENGAVVFEPFKTPARKYVGLPIVNVVERSAEKQQEYKNKDVVYIPVSRNLFKLAASIILLIALGLTLSTPLVIDESQMNYASISTPKVVVNEEVNASFVEPIANSELFIAIPDANEATAIADTTSHVLTIGNVIMPMRYETDDVYCLVVASLATQELAEEYIAEHGNGAMHILECDGKYRIFVATGATVAQTLEPTTQSAFSEKYPAAWVCRR